MIAGLPPMLSVGDVQERYSLHDPRAARQMMKQAGAAKYGRRWMVRLDALDEWERTRGVARDLVPDQEFNRSRVRTKPAPLPADWYRGCAS